jgi:DNA processing protein
MSWQLGLARLAALTGRDLQRAARRAGGGERLWSSGSVVLGRHLKLESAQLDAVRALRRTFDPAREITALEAAGIRWWPLGGDGYPARLAEIPDPPFGLFTHGSPPVAGLGAPPIVAVVGSRRATAQGRAFARVLGTELAERGALVVSGLALGIDAEAHQGALAGNGSTLAVLGCGVDVVHPRRHTDLRHRIAGAGTLVSEYWPGTPTAPWRFPARNRIVAGMADAVVVVEAGARSGALITADFALDQGRPVLAVPGSPGAAASSGCNALLRAGAAMCEGAGDVVAELPSAEWRPAPTTAHSIPDGLDGDIYEILSREPLRIDDLAVRTATDPAAVAAALARLEILGLVFRGQGQRFWASPLRGAA